MPNRYDYPLVKSLIAMPNRSDNADAALVVHYYTLTLSSLCTTTRFVTRFGPRVPLWYLLIVRREGIEGTAKPLIGLLMLLGLPRLVCQAERCVHACALCACM